MTRKRSVCASIPAAEMAMALLISMLIQPLRPRTIWNMVWYLW